VGAEELEIELKEGVLIIHSPGRGLLVIQNYKRVATDRGAEGTATVQFSMSDLQLAIQRARRGVDSALSEAWQALQGTKALVEIDLSSFDSGERDFEDFVAPLLVRDLRPGDLESARVLLKGTEDQKKRVSDEIRSFDPSLTRFVYFNESEIEADYKDVRRTVIGSSQARVLGKRLLLVKKLERGDLPNFKGLLKTAIFQDRISAEDFVVSSVYFRKFAEAYRILLQKEIPDLSDLLAVLEGVETNQEKIRYFEIPPVLKLPLNVLLQGARLAIKMAAQAA
jgi:hypothetical protein